MRYWVIGTFNPGGKRKPFVVCRWGPFTRQDEARMALRNIKERAVAFVDYSISRKKFAIGESHANNQVARL